MEILARFDIAALVKSHGVTHFLARGYGDGELTRVARDVGLERAVTYGMLDELVAREVLAGRRSLVYLPCQLGRGVTQTEASGKTYGDWERLRQIEELRTLRASAGETLIVVNDLRLHRHAGDVAFGERPDWAKHAFDRDGEFLSALQAFEATHSIHWRAEENGYALLWPLSWGEFSLKTWILPRDRTRPDHYPMGVIGMTGMSLNRRLQDARFSNRWFVGDGIDVGGGSDSISLYSSLFPQISSVTLYDWEQGDAQYLANVKDGSFDFVYSAHCLEHVVDPRIAIQHWLRVVRPGGHLVVTVPDEDLYEQGIWPSTFNGDHKHTFTVFKRASWSPVSINVLDLLRNFDREVNILKVDRLDHSYLRGGFERFDQTRLPFSECGIEFVLQKL